jgi:hypothetical protein
MTVQAQTAQDQWKDVLKNPVLDKVEMSKDSFYWMSFFSKTDKDSTKDDESDTSISGEYLGVGGGLTHADKSHLREKFSQVVDLRVIDENHWHVLLLSGQRAIIDAWSKCMSDRGGGVTTYFTSVPGGPNRVDLIIEYVRGRGFAGPDLKVEKDVYLNPKQVEVIDREDCLKKGYVIKPEGNCTVKLRTASAWTTDILTISFTDGSGQSQGYSAYLAPRARLTPEVKMWPTAELRASWAKTPHKRQIVDINSIQFYSRDRTSADDRTVVINKNCHPAEEGWYFVEGTRRPSAKNKNVMESRYVRISTHVSGNGANNERDCKGEYELDPAGNLCIGATMGYPSGEDERWCFVDVTATMVRQVWTPDPDRSAASAHLFQGKE